MADDKTNRGPQDRSRINLGEDYEARYWTDKFGVSKAQLEDAARKIGVSADAVEEELRRHIPYLRDDLAGAGCTKAKPAPAFSKSIC